MDKSEVSLLKKVVFGFLASVVCLVFLFGSYSIVNPGTMGIKVTLGKASTVALQPGLHLKLPILSSIVPMSVRSTSLR